MNMIFPLCGKEFLFSALLSSFDGFFVCSANCQFISSWVSIVLVTYAAPTYRKCSKTLRKFCSSTSIAHFPTVTIQHSYFLGIPYLLNFESYTFQTPWYLIRRYEFFMEDILGTSHHFHFDLIFSKKLQGIMEFFILVIIFGHIFREARDVF
jgi:hypothetical protein